MQRELSYLIVLKHWNVLVQHHQICCLIDFLFIIRSATCALSWNVLSVNSCGTLISPRISLSSAIMEWMHLGVHNWIITEVQFKYSIAARLEVIGSALLSVLRQTVQYLWVSSEVVLKPQPLIIFEDSIRWLKPKEEICMSFASSLLQVLWEKLHKFLCFLSYPLRLSFLIRQSFALYSKVSSRFVLNPRSWISSLRSLYGVLSGNLLSFSFSLRFPKCLPYPLETLKQLGRCNILVVSHLVHILWYISDICLSWVVRPSLPCLSPESFSHRCYPRTTFGCGSWLWKRTILALPIGWIDAIVRLSKQLTLSIVQAGLTRKRKRIVADMIRLGILVVGYIDWVIGCSNPREQLLRILFHIYVINYKNKRDGEKESNDRGSISKASYKARFFILQRDWCAQEGSRVHA